MNFRKIIALLITLAILTSVFVMPASAEPTEEKFKKYIINDQFNTAGDTNGWVKGSVKSGTAAFTVTQGAAPDGSGALVLHSEGGSSGAAGQQPNAYKAFPQKIPFSADNKTTIKVRFMQTGAADHANSKWGILKFNQPNNIAFSTVDDMKWNWTNTWHRTDAVPSGLSGTASGYNTLCKWFELLEFDNTQLGFMAANDQKNWKCSTYSAVNTVNKWIEAEFVISGNENIKLTAKIGDVQGPTVNATLKQDFSGPRIAYTLYNDTTATEWMSAFTSLDSLTWETTFKNDIYIDYVEVYQEVDYVDATVDITSGTTNIRANDPIVIKFTADTDVPSIPEEAFELVGVETDFEYNPATKTVTLTQNEALEPGGEYTLNINKELIKAKSGIIITNDVSYTLGVCDISVSNLTPVKEIADGLKTVTATYTYASSKDPGEHLYQWQESATGEESSFTDIVGATESTYTYSVSGADKYIRFKMTPYDIEENPGYETISSVLAPEMAPVASSVTLSTDLIFEGVYVTATYDFDDVNGDEEGASVIKWLTADSADSLSWTEKHVGDIYVVGSDDAGKFIKCEVTPVSKSEILPQGAPDYSPAIEIVDMLQSTNMYSDPGFENGTIEAPWIYSNNWTGADIQSKDVHSGNYALHLAPRTALNDHFGQKLSFSKDKTYVFGAYGKKSRDRAQDVKGMTVFAGGDTLQTSVGTETYVLNERWKLMSFAYKFVADCTPNSGFVTWTDIDTADVYLDDFYCGPLLIGDIETYDIEPITIPQSGEVVIPVTSGKALNQLGKNDGLQDETVVVSIPDVDGVYVDGNKIVVTEQAYASEFTAKVYCEPKYFGATQDIFQKFIKIKLVAHDDPSPKALNVNATGVVATDSVLTGSYDFYQIEQKADNSEYKWVYSDTADGVYKDILGATGLTYTVTSGYADKYIKFVVMPKTDDLIEGEAAYSKALVAPKKPVAANVKITGDIATGLTVNGEYEFTDANNDVEGTSTYRWLISDSEQGAYAPVDGQTQKTLTLTEAMQGKYIKFEVTPVSLVDLENGTQMEIDAAVGQTVTSNAVLGPVPPQALNVSMSKDGYRLKGMYTYNHPHYIPEKGTLYEWKVDGVLVATTPDYIINFNGTKTVSFSVTPMCEDQPSKGETVTVSVQITGYTENQGASGGGGYSGGGGGGSAGGGGGSGTGVGVTNVNDMKIPEVEVQKPQEEQKPVSDISGHWGETYINNMVSRGVMTADESGNHKPDENVSREIMLTYLFKALGLETTEYKNEFTDIENGEFASMLQTMVDNGTIAKDTAFRPNDTISREEMCKILYVSLKNANKLVETDEMVIEAFADYNNISEWARVYVNGIYANKIMVGVSDTEFDAKGTVTKAQAATMLVRILALTEEAK